MRRSGVYANGRVAVVKGRELEGGVYELFIDKIERTAHSEPLPVERPEDFEIVPLASVVHDGDTMDKSTHNVI